MNIADRLRIAAVLAHSVPGVGLDVECVGGDTLVVAARRLDAALDPCQFRTALLAPAQPGVPRLADAVVNVRVRHGLVHLGGGLYARRGVDGDERWFASTLPHPALDALLAGCPMPEATRAISARLCVDVDLGVTAVCLTSSAGWHPGGGDPLEAVAAWALTAATVEELIASCQDEVRP